MKCLNCSAEMTCYAVHNLASKCSYDVCDACGGLWLDKGELDKLAYDTGDSGDIEYCSKDEVDGPPSKHSCPRCNLTLHRVDCHGVWLGYDDLEAIRQFEKYELDKLTSKEMEAKVKETFKKIWTDNSESKASEILDAYASVSALAFVAIYEHPALAKLLLGVGTAGTRAGLG